MWKLISHLLQCVDGEIYVILNTYLHSDPWIPLVFQEYRSTGYLPGDIYRFTNLKSNAIITTSDIHENKIQQVTDLSCGYQLYLVSVDQNRVDYS